MGTDGRTYVLVHDHMDEHPKIEGLSDAAFRALHRCLYWCSRNLTDGRLTDAAWKNRARTPKVRRELVDAGLVHLAGVDCPHPECDTPAPSGFVQMHDYLDWQRSAAEVEDLKRKRAEAGSKGGKAKAKALASATASGKQTASKSVPPTELPTEHTHLGGESLEPNARGHEPPRCPDHTGMARWDVPDCRRCGQLREAWEAQRGADDVFARPPWCGQCDEWTRLCETDDGMARCSNCHPLALGATA